MSPSSISNVLREAGIKNPEQLQLEMLVEMAIDPNASREHLEDSWVFYEEE